MDVKKKKAKDCIAIANLPCRRHGLQVIKNDKRVVDDLYVAGKKRDRNGSRRGMVFAFHEQIEPANIGLITRLGEGEVNRLRVVAGNVESAIGEGVALVDDGQGLGIGHDGSAATGGDHDVAERLGVIVDDFAGENTWAAGVFGRTLREAPRDGVIAAAGKDGCA